MNHTPNYQLSQWAASDRVQRADFNADNAKIDAALAGKAEQSALAALTQTVAEKGNCRILTGSYVGTGAHGYTLTLGVLPKLVVVTGGASLAIFVYGQADTALLSREITSSIDTTWTEDGLSWYCSRVLILNNEGRTYTYVAFY